MKILLTGASGFVGSHILDELVRQGLQVALLLRSTSSADFIRAHADTVEIRRGSIEDASSLAAAMQGITHVIHCAGRTAACSLQEFLQTNQAGTRNIVQAVNATPGIKRLLHISSLAVSGPGTPERPATVEGARLPISDYGKSKLAAEEEVTSGCRVDWVVIRPPAVYGPRDNGFYTMFKAVKSHLLPRTNSRQHLSLVYVEDLARTVVAALFSEKSSRKIYFAACPEIVTARQMSEIIARQMGTWTVPVPLPPLALLPLCLAEELVQKVTGKPRLLNLQKLAELRAPGWVCDSTLLAKDLGFACATRLEEGVAHTLAWYRGNGWL